jgi:hypothetical protein
MTRARANPQAPWSAAKAARRVLTRDDAWADEWIETLRRACPSKQRDFVDDPSRRISGLGSRGAGKSRAAFARLLVTMGRRRRAPCLFIAQTREQATDIIWPQLKDTIERLGIETDIAEVRRRCTFRRNGSTLRLCGADDRKEIDKLRGTAYAGVVIDEAASFDPKLLETLILRVLGPRLGEHDGWIALIGTPGHVLRGMFYDVTRPGSPLHRPYSERDRPEWAGWVGWSSHHWTLRDGAAAGIKAIERLWAEAMVEKQRQGWSDTHPIWLREYEARWAADDTDNVFRYRPHDDEGAAWNQWDPERVGPLRFAKLPEDRSDWHYAYAIDFGHNDPCAVSVFAFSPTDPTRTIYHVYGFESPEFYARRLAELLLGEGLSTDRPGGLYGVTGWPVGIVADADDALLAELSNVYGIRAQQAKRQRDHKFGAIELVNGDLVDGRLKVLKGSKLEEQLMELQWVVAETGELRENKAQANHSSDTLVYGRRLIAHLFETGQVGEDERKRKRRPEGIEESDPHGGDWSDILASGTYEDDDPWP